MPQTEPQEQDSSFSSLGFTKTARRNLVIAIMSIQFVALAAEFKYTMVLNDRIDKLNETKANEYAEMYNKLVNQMAEKLNPVRAEIKSLNDNSRIADSLQKQLVADNKLKVKQ